MKKTYTILAFNALIVSILFAPFAYYIADVKSSFNAFLFIIMTYAATIVIVSSYRVGRVIFNRENSKILSAGFFYVLIGFFFLLILTLGYLDFIQGFKSPKYIVNSIALITSFVLLPMLAAKPNTMLLKAISRITKEF